MKIIIAEADRELCSDLCARLRKRLPAGSLEVVDDGRGLMERVMALHPVLVVLDTLLPGRDGLSLLHDLRRLPRDSQPEVIVLSRLLGGALLTEIAQLQPAFFTTLPCDLQELTERILNCCREQMRAGMDPAMGVDQRIARQLHALGLAARSKGFSYARLGIRRILEDRRLANALTKQLYPEIASHFETKPACVERAIRSAITAAWQKEGILWQTTLFHQRPTNGEFLTVLADLLREEAAGQME